MLGLDNPLHIAFLLVLLLLVFGAKRLPEMGKSLGAGLRGFKESISGEDTPAAQITPAAPDHARGSDHASPGRRAHRAAGRPHSGTASRLTAAGFERLLAHLRVATSRLR